MLQTIDVYMVMRTYYSSTVSAACQESSLQFGLSVSTVPTHRRGQTSVTEGGSLKVCYKPTARPSKASVVHVWTKDGTAHGQRLQLHCNNYYYVITVGQRLICGITMYKCTNIHQQTWLVITSNYLTYTSQFYIFKLCQTFRPHSAVIISGKYRIGLQKQVQNWLVIG